MNYKLENIKKIDIYKHIDKNICNFYNVIKILHYINNFNKNIIENHEYIKKDELNNKDNILCIVSNIDNYNKIFKNILTENNSKNINIINLPNIYEIIDFNMEIYNKVFSITNINENIIENELINVNKIFLEIVYIFRILKVGGSVKINFNSINLKNTVDLVELLYDYFENIKIEKNNNFNNNNRLITCEKFKGITENEKRYYINILEDLYYHNDKVLMSLYNKDYNYKTLNIIKESNIEIENKILNYYNS